MKYVNEGRSLSRAGKGKQALKSLQRAISLDPGCAEAYRERARVNINLGYFDRAKNDIEQALRLRPKDGEAWFIYGKMMGDALKPAESAAGYSKAIEYGHDYSSNFADRARQYDALGEWRKAEADLTTAISKMKTEKYSGSKDGHMFDVQGLYKDRGDVYFRHDCFDKAISDYTQCIQDSPHPIDSIVGHQRRAAAYQKMGRSKECIDDLTVCIKLEGSSERQAEDYCQRATAHLKLNDKDAAIADLSKAIELEPRRTTARIQRAKIYDQIGKHDLAERDRAMAKQIDKSFFGE